MPVEIAIAVDDEQLLEVFGYLLHRCPAKALAEDLTSETFLSRPRLDPSAAVVTYLLACQLRDAVRLDSSAARSRLAKRWCSHSSITTAPRARRTGNDSDSG